MYINIFFESGLWASILVLDLDLEKLRTGTAHEHLLCLSDGVCYSWPSSNEAAAPPRVDGDRRPREAQPRSATNDQRLHQQAHHSFQLLLNRYSTACGTIIQTRVAALVAVFIRGHGTSQSLELQLHNIKASTSTPSCLLGMK
jgi:hypothetical protein